MDQFISNWGDAALTSLGFFWMAFWAFALGYSQSHGYGKLAARESQSIAAGT